MITLQILHFSISFVKFYLLQDLLAASKLAQVRFLEKSICQLLMLSRIFFSHTESIHLLRARLLVMSLSATLARAASARRPQAGGDGIAGKAPMRPVDLTPHRRAHTKRARAYARRHRHSLAHLYAESVHDSLVCGPLRTGPRWPAGHNCRRDRGRRPLTRAFTLRNRAAGPRNLAGMRTAEGEPRRGRRRLAVSLGGGRHRQDPSCRADAGVPGRSGSRAIHTPDPHQLYR